MILLFDGKKLKNCLFFRIW